MVSRERRKKRGLPCHSPPSSPPSLPSGCTGTKLVSLTAGPTPKVWARHPFLANYCLKDSVHAGEPSQWMRCFNIPYELLLQMAASPELAAVWSGSTVEMLTLILLLPEFCPGARHRQAGDNFWWDGKRVGSIWYGGECGGGVSRLRHSPLRSCKHFSVEWTFFQIYKMQSKGLSFFLLV